MKEYKYRVESVTWTADLHSVQLCSWLFSYCFVWHLNKIHGNWISFGLRNMQYCPSTHLLEHLIKLGYSSFCLNWNVTLLSLLDWHELTNNLHFTLYYNPSSSNEKASTVTLLECGFDEHIFPTPQKKVVIKMHYNIIHFPRTTRLIFESSMHKMVTKKLFFKDDSF